MKTHFKTSKLCLTALTVMTLAFGSGGAYSASYANPRSQDPISCSDPKTQFPTLPPCYRTNSLTSPSQGATGLMQANYSSHYISSTYTQLNARFNSVAGNDGVQ